MAAAHLASADMILATGSLTGRVTVAAELHAHREVLLALSWHAHHLLEPRRHGRRHLRIVATLHPIEAAQRHLAEELAVAVPRRSQARCRPAPSVGSTAPDWLAAARAVRAASDLLATHHDPVTRKARTPDAHLLDRPAVRLAGLRQIAQLAETAASAAAPMRARGQAAGLGSPALARPLPDPTALRAAAGYLLVVSDEDQDAAARLAALGLARPRVRVGQPLNELHDRLAHLRQAAWELRDQGVATIDVLAGFAAVAASWHRHAAAHQGPARD